MLKDHIRGQNVYLRGEFYMEPEKLEELLTTEHHDATMVILKEFAEKQREFNHLFCMLDGRWTY